MLNLRTLLFSPGFKSIWASVFSRHLSLWTPSTAWELGTQAWLELINSVSLPQLPFLSLQEGQSFIYVDESKADSFTILVCFREFCLPMSLWLESENELIQIYWHNVIVYLLS